MLPPFRFLRFLLAPLLRRWWTVPRVVAVLDESAWGIQQARRRHARGAG
jgi:hypothetical protein